MNWALTNPDKARRLERAFYNRKIDFSTPGFSDHPNFLKEEQKNPQFLDAYAQYVEARSYTPEYLIEASRKIMVATDAMQAAVAAHGAMGACVHASSSLARMFDRLGVWNYVGKANLIISYPEAHNLPETFFYSVDTKKFYAPHAIVVAPPYYIIDVTAKYQPFEYDQQTALTPAKVLIDRFVPTEWESADLISPDYRAIAALSGMNPAKLLETKYQHMLDVIRELPPRQMAPSGPDKPRLRYIIVAVGGFVEQLEEIEGYSPGGRSVLEIFNEDVLPKL